MSKEIKQKLRNKYLKILKDISFEQREQWNESIFQQFSSSSYFQDYHVFALYYSLPYEVDTIKIIEFLLENNKKVALPRMSNQNLEFYYINSLSELVVDNPWNIFQPKNSNKIAKVKDLDLIVLPLVAFNKNYYRLGHGKGYYDRYLSKSNLKTLKLVLAYKIQEIASDVVFLDDWDVPFDVIITN
ncbi:MAG: 5-formyltetrahydrofolate cyclo-ligase [Spiroplasma sp.]